jgi:hypothetical protein
VTFLTFFSIDPDERSSLLLLLGDPLEEATYFNIAVGNKMDMIVYKVDVCITDDQLVIVDIRQSQVKEFVFDLFLPANKHSLRVVLSTSQKLIFYPHL